MTDNGVFDDPIYKMASARADREKSRAEAAEAALREIIDSIPSTYDENDPSVKRHARALNAGLKLIRRIDAALQAAREGT